jgi:hypothetical protein
MQGNGSALPIAERPGERPTSEETAMGRGMIDLTGQRFGRLRVVDFAGMAGASRMWLCVCDCGTKT